MSWWNDEDEDRGDVADDVAPVPAPAPARIQIVTADEIRSQARELLKRMSPMDELFRRVALIGSKSDFSYEDYNELQKAKGSAGSGGAKRRRQRRRGGTRRKH